MQPSSLLTKFGVLLLGDFSALSARQAERLRADAIPAWTASTDFEVHWLMQLAAVSASVALVDLRHVEADVDRNDELRRIAALASEAMLPTVLVGVSEHESQAFRSVIAKLTAAATDDDVAAAIAAIAAKNHRS